MNKLDRSKNRWWELLRFCITGATAALCDYIVCQLIVLAFSSVTINSGWITAISTTGGFVIGVIINYIMSTFWVYQNVANKDKTKTPLFILLFVVFSIGGLLVSILAMVICDLIVKSGFGYSIVDVSIMELIKQYGISFLSQSIFWSYFISFCVKTLVGFIFNYFTRKYILYKEPKSDKENQ